jgi:hypothetical protein
MRDIDGKDGPQHTPLKSRKKRRLYRRCTSFDTGRLLCRASVHELLSPAMKV